MIANEFHILWIEQRVIILNRGSMPRKWTARKRCNSSRPHCATLQCDVTRDWLTSLETHWLMALVGGGGAEEEVCVLRSPGIAASPISILSMGGVCGRSLTAGKILFTGSQTCSLYLVLWLCGFYSFANPRLVKWMLAKKRIPNINNDCNELHFLWIEYTTS